MGHTITISAENVKSYVSNCDALIENIEETKTKLDSTKLNSTLNEYIGKINQFKNEIMNQVGKEETQQILTRLSTIQKEVANFALLKNNLIIDDIVSNSFDLTKIVSKYGYVGLDALELMESQHIEINENNVVKTIEQMQAETVNEAKRVAYIEQAYQVVDQSDLPDLVKKLLKQDIRDSKTYQELSDIQPLIISKKQEYQRLVQTRKDLNQKLKEMGFSIDKSIGLKIETDSYSNIVFKYSLKNASNNSVSMILNSDGQIKYKLGNYVGHMCNKTTEKLIEKLRNDGYNIKVTSIKRDVNNNRPLAMERELK